MNINNKYDCFISSIAEVEIIISKRLKVPKWTERPMGIAKHQLGEFIP